MDWIVSAGWGARAGRWANRRLVALFPALLLLAGCGTGTSATGAYTGPRPANAPYSKVLVVGVAPSSRARRSFEQQAVEAISGEGTRATASIFVAAEMNLGELSAENVRAMAEKTAADAVLVTRLIDRQAWLGQTQGKAYVKVGPQVTVIEQPGLTEVYEGYYSVHPVEGLPVAESAANVESVLYDVGDHGRAVYKIALNSEFEETDAEVYVDVVGELAAGIAGELRGDGLIR